MVKKGSYIVSNALESLFVLLEPFTIILILFGVTAGLIVGAIPGLTATMAMALIIPFTYSLSTSVSIAVLLGIYVGAISGGLVSAILLKIPGTPSSCCTCFDGFPMARNGYALKALGTGILSSFIGGTISFIILILISPQLAKLALKFGPHEYFAVGLLGMSTIAGISSGSTLKGLISACLGLFLSTVGLDVITGQERYTFGLLELTGGIDFVAALIGLFAISQVLADISNIIEQHNVTQNTGSGKMFPTFEELKRNFVNIIRSSFIGTWIGVLPGAGGSIASMIAYDQAKRASHEPDKFGTGYIDGVIASETANNAVIGGALIPLLTLGIPGDTPAAILLAALTLHGIQPGPMLPRINPEVLNYVFISLFIANFMMIIVALAFMKYLVKIISIPKYILLPLIVILCVVGTYSINNRFLDVVIMIMFGFVGFALERESYSTAPIVLGLILGPIIEGEFRRAVTITNGDLSSFITRPVSALVLVFTFAMFVMPLIRKYYSSKRRA